MPVMDGLEASLKIRKDLGLSVPMIYPDRQCPEWRKSSLPRCRHEWLYHQTIQGKKKWYRSWSGISGWITGLSSMILPGKFHRSTTQWQYSQSGNVWTRFTYYQSINQRRTFIHRSVSSDRTPGDPPVQKSCCLPKPLLIHHNFLNTFICLISNGSGMSIFSSRIMYLSRPVWRTLISSLSVVYKNNLNNGWSDLPEAELNNCSTSAVTTVLS